MVVVHIRRSAAHGGSGDQLDLWISCSDGIVEGGEAIIVAARPIKEIFITDLHVLNVEWSRVPVSRSFCAPGSTGAAGRILDFIQRILHKGVELRCADRNMRSIESVTRIHGQQR